MSKFLLLSVELLARQATRQILAVGGIPDGWHHAVRRAITATWTFLLFENAGDVEVAPPLWAMAQLPPYCFIALPVRNFDHQPPTRYVSGEIQAACNSAARERAQLLPSRHLDFNALCRTLLFGHHPVSPG
ncbi:hypothetical protein ABIB73_007369 [Bradyrhizobium sp. F1.4.3]|uniref:hypothetical protein n=1 Tax=Bradyrhizobium sp. F1.4.3 TaxID=3156356 RepID=UPI00339AF2D2